MMTARSISLALVCIVAASADQATAAGDGTDCAQVANDKRVAISRAVSEQPGHPHSYRSDHLEEAFRDQLPRTIPAACAAVVVDQLQENPPVTVLMHDFGTMSHQESYSIDLFIESYLTLFGLNTGFVDDYHSVRVFIDLSGGIDVATFSRCGLCP